MKQKDFDRFSPLNSLSILICAIQKIFCNILIYEDITSVQKKNRYIGKTAEHDMQNLSRNELPLVNK